MSNLSLYHLVREPGVTSKKAPALILLHGYGSNEEDLFSFASELPEEYFVISVRAPYDLQPYGHAWYDIHFTMDNEKFSDNEQAVASRDIIAQFIDQACEAYPIDKNKINLLGFSQGCILSYAIALTYPEKVRNIVALSGYINEDIIGDTKDKDYSHLDFYISHGSVDQVIPVQWAQKAPEYLMQFNIKQCYAEFPVGHGVAPQNFFDFKKWLEVRL
ncbi:MAG: alpha/beta fold hydrolase [Flavobacteriaceae bacterium]|nr:alpha/beta fold hydrolase [Flavobacteriaceae bacterium]